MIVSPKVTPNLLASATEYLRMMRDYNGLMFFIEQLLQRQYPRLKFWQANVVVGFVY